MKNTVTVRDKALRIMLIRTRMWLFYGDITATAHACRVSVSLVRKVLTGARKNQYILMALQERAAANKKISTETKHRCRLLRCLPDEKGGGQ